MYRRSKIVQKKSKMVIEKKKSLKPVILKYYRTRLLCLDYMYNTSSGCGSMETVIVLVCIRPPDSVLGTLCTRWTPPSYFMASQISSPEREMVALRIQSVRKKISCKKYKSNSLLNLSRLLSIYCTCSYMKRV